MLTITNTNMISAIEYQSESAQDMVHTGDDWMVVCDGHGVGNTINHLRTLNWGDIVKQPDPSKSINESILPLGDTARDGSTLSIVRIKDDGIDCAWIGDSQIRIYADNTEVWRSENHNKDNENEVNRHISAGGTMKKSWGIRVIDPQTITMEPSRYFEFNKCECIAMTRALGHNQLYTPIAVRHFLEFRTYPGVSVWKVVVGTDGLWDMICPEDDTALASPVIEACDLGELALSRWNQEWNYQHPPPLTSISCGERISSKMDDIGVAVWQKWT